MKRALLLLLAASLLSFTGQSQSFDKVKLDAYFDTLANNNRFMGSVAVSRNGELIYTKSVGYADFENALKANENSKYRIASVSKTFTAVLTLKAIEEGKLKLNQTIDPFFPSIKNAQKITIEHLLYHRSGIPEFVDDSWLEWHTQFKTEQEMIEIISNGGSEFEPDTKTNYCNSNFVLLSYILEKIYKKPYSDILEEKIINPVGLKNTYCVQKINSKDNECHSYSYEDGWTIKPETDMSIFAGAGDIVSTPVDLTLFSEALFNGKLVSKKSLKQMETMKDDLGMGLNQVPFYSKTGFGHVGGIDGFSSFFVYFPDSKISFAYTVNGVNHYLNDVFNTVLSAVFGKSFKIPVIKTYYVTDEDLDKYLGVYSNKEFEIDFTITKTNGKLILQGTRQPPISLEAIDKDTFERARAGVILEFNLTNKSMAYKQGEAIFYFEKALK
jgi:CubicO group peptidase (beta-lactamase class C family)